jgi:TetR/AcrR family transcriptional repressor of nem operon
VVGEAKGAGLAGAAVDAREAARSIVAQIEGRVLLAKLLNDPAQLDTLWRNCLDLLQVPLEVRASAVADAAC